MERKYHTHSRSVPANKRYFVGLNGIAHNKIGWVCDVRSRMHGVCVCFCVSIFCNFHINSIVSLGSSWLNFSFNIWLETLLYIAYVLCVYTGVLRYTSFMSRDIIWLLHRFLLLSSRSFFLSFSLSQCMRYIRLVIFLLRLFHIDIHTHIAYRITHITKL